jgi:hypothetical protein
VRQPEHAPASLSQPHRRLEWPARGAYSTFAACSAAVQRRRARVVIGNVDGTCCTLMALPPSCLSHTTPPQLPTMVRGAAKAVSAQYATGASGADPHHAQQAQAKAAKNAPKEAKSTIPGRAAALKLTCHICRTPAPVRGLSGPTAACADMRLHRATRRSSSTTRPSTQRRRCRQRPRSRASAAGRAAARRGRRGVTGNHRASQRRRVIGREGE